jgi:hypothetical protein
MIKRWIALLSMVSLSLAACGDNGEGGNNNEDPPPVTNNYSVEGGELVDPRTVSVESVDTIGPSWIVVFEGSTLLGHAAVADGESTDVTIELDVSLSGGSHTLEAILFEDTGTEGLFEVPGSDRPIIENGEVVSSVFQVSLDPEFDPAVVAEYQTRDYNGAGVVTIASATARDDAWVTVRSGPCTRDLDDAGTIRGFRDIARGETSDLDVELTPELSGNETLCAYLHEDSPKDGEFNYEEDGDEDPPINVEGSLISAEFIATTPIVEASDQTISGSSPNAVTIDRVASVGPGWIALRRGECALDGEVVGHAAVADGESADIVVDLNENEWILGPTATFCAVLHDDDPEGDFTYPNEDDDPPVEDLDGNRTDAEFVVTVNAPQTPGLEVSDQVLIDTEVLVDSLYVPAGRWLALYTDDGQGARDTLIGSRAIFPTPQQNVPIDFDTGLAGRSLEDGETLHIAVHTDDPNDEVFDPQGDDDPVVLDDTGEEFSESLVVTVPSLSVSDQTADPATDIVVDRVRAFGAGWLVAYDGSCPNAAGPWGTRLGFVMVPDGVSTDITLTVDSALTDQQTVCVALHRDNPDDETFTNSDPASPPDVIERRPADEPVQRDIVVTVP